MLLKLAAGVIGPTLLTDSKQFILSRGGVGKGEEGPRFTCYRDEGRYGVTGATRPLLTPLRVDYKED